LQHYGVVPKAPGDLYSKLLAIVKFALPACSDEQLHAIMEQRVIQSQSSQESFDLLKSSDLEQILGQSTKTEANKFTEDFGSNQKECEAFKTRLKEHGKRLMASKPKPRAADTKRGTRAMTARIFTPGEHELMSAESVKEFLPPTCSIRKDFPNQRWLLKRGRRPS